MRFVLELTVKVKGLVVDPLDHWLKLYPELGVAVTVTSDPCEKVPPVVETLPPCPAVTERVYCFTIDAGGGASSSSDEQESTKPIRNRVVRNFFIIKNSK